MKIIKVNLGKRTYNIAVGRGILRALPRHIAGIGIGKDAYIITNSFLKKSFGGLVSKILKKSDFTVRFKTVADGEKSKSFKAASEILNDLSGYDKRKRIFILALGGGVVGDLAGFVASIYKRGTPLIQVPTTLLAQVDSSIGGKTGVDLKEGKNLSGTFYQPKLVLSDTDLLNTLDKRQLRAGLAEVIKYAVIKDKQLFSYLENNLKDILKRKAVPLEFVVARSSAIKAAIVAKDETEEKGLRTILNFGHTLGHAIEAAAGFKRYNHGEAVALGMLLACDLSKRLKLLDAGVAKRIEQLILAAGLPTKAKGLKIARIIKAYYHDKKFKGSRNRFVLIAGIGKTKIVENIPLALVKEVLRGRF
jgi:3-dehydroquinate synthase